MPFRWVTICPDCGEEHPDIGTYEHVGIRTASTQPSEVALDAVRSGDLPLPTHELVYTSHFTPVKNRPLTHEEKTGG